MGGDRDQLPAAARRARRAPGRGHALAHAGARATSSRRRARSSAASRSCARSGPRRTGSTSRRPTRRWPRRSSAARPRYAAAADALERRGDLLGRASRRTRRWTSAATHAVLPLLATDAGVRLQLATGIASHRARFGDWGGGFWLPECAHAPWLDDAARGGRRARRRASTGPTCSAPGRSRRAAREAGVVLGAARPRGDRAGLAPRRLPVARRLPRHAPADRAPPPRVGERRRRLRPRRAPRPGRAADAADFVRARGRARRAVGGGARHRAARPLLARGRRLAAGRARGLRAPRASSWRRSARARSRTRPAEPPVTSWGDGRDLRTWSGPRRGGLAWTPARAPSCARSAAARGPSDRALRELLALQSSDWAFLISAGTAGDYPGERAEAHRAAFEAALADPAIDAGAAQSGAAALKVRPAPPIIPGEAVCKVPRFVTTEPCRVSVAQAAGNGGTAGAGCHGSRGESPQ